MERGNYPDWLLAAQASSDIKMDEMDVTVTPEDVLSLKSPKRAAFKAGIFDAIPTLLYHDDDEVSTSGSAEDIQHSVAEFRHQFSRLKQKWTSAFQDIEVGHLLVTTDLDKVSDVTNKLASYVGHPIAIDGTLFTNIWQALSDSTTKL
jgi:hypothetical protein